MNMAESIIILLYRTLLIQHLNYMWETCLEISEIWFSYPLKGVKKHMKNTMQQINIAH